MTGDELLDAAAHALAAVELPACPDCGHPERRLELWNGTVDFTSPISWPPGAPPTDHYAGVVVVAYCAGCEAELGCWLPEPEAET